MTLTLPNPEVPNPARQRLALELLLQQQIPGPDQLQASRPLLSTALAEVTPEHWQRLQALPIGIDADHLDLAIPSQWREQEWQQLIDQLPEQHRTIRLHPVIEADLIAALHAEIAETPTNPSPKPAVEVSSPGPAEPHTELDTDAESFLQDFSADGVLENDEDEESQQAQDKIVLALEPADHRTILVYRVFYRNRCDSVLAAKTRPSNPVPESTLSKWRPQRA